MERFIFEVIEPLISKDLDQERRQARIQTVKDNLKAFIKGELVPINKQLSKKTRELFVACSDIETLKENLQAHEKEAIKLRGEVAARQNDLSKQKMIFERDMNEFKEEMQKLKKQIRRLQRYYRDQIQRTNNEWQEKMIDAKKQLRQQFQSTLERQRQEHSQEMQSQRETFTNQKNAIIQETSKEKSRLIKKYEEKIYNLKNQNEEQIQKLTQQFTKKIEDLRHSKSELFQKLSNQEIKCRKLTLELQKEVGQHNKFRAQFESTFRQLEGNRQRNEEQRAKLLKENQQLRTTYRQMQKKLSGELHQVRTILKQTIQEKDKKYIDTVQLMNTEHRIEVQSLQNNMIEQREIVLSNFQMKAYQQMFAQTKKYQSLEAQFKDLEIKYNSVKQFYEKQIKKIKDEHQNEINSLIQRKQYEYELEGQNARRQYNNLRTKYTLQIKSMKNQHAIDVQNLQKKAQQDRIALSNKLITQYQGILADQRTNTQIQIKQKLMQFERKAKGYDKRIAEAQKRKSELKVVMQRMKIQSQMKIESMMQVNQKLQSQIQELHQRILELQKNKSVLINDYQFQLLLVKNQLEKVKEEYKQRQDDLRANLNERIIVKNKQIAKFSQRIKIETQQLIRKNKERVHLLQKQYEQLKRVINQKTSLPQDIEALKVFHAAYLEKETELISQRKKRQELQRQLHSKDAIQKVFVAKQAFKRLTVIDKISQTSKNFFIKQNIQQT